MSFIRKGETLFISSDVCIRTLFSVSGQNLSHQHLHPLLVGDNADQLGGELLDLVLLLARMLLQHRVLLEEAEIPDQ